MENGLYRLTAAPSASSWVESKGDQQDERPIPFLDFLVDDRPMRDLLDVPEDWEQPLYETTALRDDWRPKAVVDYLDRLLGVLPGDYEDGRVSLLICVVCGDLWCGAVSVELALSPQTVTWQKIGWQGDPEDVEPETLTEQSFTFDRDEYEQLLRGLREHYKKQALVPPPLRFLRRLFRRGSSS
ncbi:hypothetical protein ARGLB_029_00020 [Arthrobacter globiformis NBRC 12137]|uniref:Oxidoreductase n=1 Tax=Arthrobacter globiformis (strain ATCC 8010 / DSM 20124 / JCM 1332 / NBRC 12137 / NCIMB 8907 / NRRL B-2979 / 168) TaxID=1077972 RepID=H0QJC5_ARTG1|nr:hypothetical protein [Arthrobacter globiformis]GAB12926.1 hypothetical protein ARGLB_029_00020 [Arthrobacter globiformis NBRC 12137]